MDITNDSTNLPKVAVLMSTYNGSAWVVEQINSIMSQENVEIKLIIRDDGSTDDTINLLKSLNLSNTTIIEGENIGASNSFSEMLKNCIPLEYPYIAFSDQDDVWYPKKLINAIQMLLTSRVNFYFSSRHIVRNNSCKIIRTIPSHKITPTVYNSIFENPAAGCTTVLTGEGAKMYGSIKRPHPIPFDFWIYLLAVWNFDVVFDPNAQIQYRIHENNSVGLPGNLSRLKSLLLKTVPRAKICLESIPEAMARKNTQEFDRLNSIFRTDARARRIFYVCQIPKIRSSTFQSNILKIYLAIKPN